MREACDAAVRDRHGRLPASEQVEPEGEEKHQYASALLSQLSLDAVSLRDGRPSASSGDQSGEARMAHLALVHPSTPRGQKC